MTFLAYLKSKRRESSPVGEFARDVVSSVKTTSTYFPAQPKSFQTVQAFLEKQGASEGAIEAAEQAFKDWKGSAPKLFQQAKIPDAKIQHVLKAK